ISVLTLVRGDNVIPNPREDRILEEDDRLLCFGSLSEMRTLIPARRRRRARPKPKPLPEDPLPRDPLPTGEAADGRSERPAVMRAVVAMSIPAAATIAESVVGG
ncbi:MAG: hypothetical protein OER95_03090, partial [Acidimicrobiia bacterium]|nr:hypothetical protein [Acidimicrobiia bacterium]